jgi:hypothetical protein
MSASTLGAKGQELLSDISQKRHRKMPPFFFGWPKRRACFSQKNVHPVHSYSFDRFLIFLENQEIVIFEKALYARAIDRQ